MWRGNKEGGVDDDDDSSYPFPDMDLSFPLSFLVDEESHSFFINSFNPSSHRGMFQGRGMILQRLKRE